MQTGGKGAAQPRDRPGLVLALDGGKEFRLVPSPLPAGERMLGLAQAVFGNVNEAFQQANELSFPVAAALLIE